jgi:hypothetical protein
LPCNPPPPTFLARRYTAVANGQLPPTPWVEAEKRLREGFLFKFANFLGAGETGLLVTQQADCSCAALALDISTTAILLVHRKHHIALRCVHVHGEESLGPVAEPGAGPDCLGSAVPFQEIMGVTQPPHSRRLQRLPIKATSPRSTWQLGTLWPRVDPLPPSPMVGRDEGWGRGIPEQSHLAERGGDHVCVCMRACVHACVRVCVRVCVSTPVCMYIRAHVRRRTCACVRACMRV